MSYHVTRRTVKVVIEAIVELGDTEDYADGLPLAEQAIEDSEMDPAYFLAEQMIDWKIVNVEPSTSDTLGAVENVRVEPSPIGCSDCRGYGYHGHTNPELGDRCTTCKGTGLTL